MLPLFVTVNLTGPAGTVVSDNWIVHSDSLALTGAGLPRGAGVAATRAPASSSPPTLRITAIGFCLILAFLMLGWQQYRPSGRLHFPRPYSAGNKLVARGVLS